MADADFFIGQGNRLPLITYQLLGPTAVPPNPVARKARLPVDLTGCTVTFRMEGAEACCHGVVIGTAGAVTILDAKGGAVQYAWAAGDTDRPGTYKATWIVRTAAGLPMDVPNNGYILVRIRPKIGS